MIFQVFIAMMGTLAFSVLFSAPVRHWFYCSATGGFGWLIYLLLTSQGFTMFPATIAAAFAITLLSRGISVVKKAPATIFLTTGIFPLVPGAGIYYTAYYLFSSDFGQAMEKFVETLTIAGAIVLGILFGFSIPQKFFLYLHKIKKDS